MQSALGRKMSEMEIDKLDEIVVDNCEKYCQYLHMCGDYEESNCCDKLDCNRYWQFKKMQKVYEVIEDENVQG